MNKKGWNCVKHKKSSIEHSCASAWPNSKPHRLAGHHQVGRRKLYTARGTPFIGFLFPNHAPIVLLLNKTEPIDHSEVTLDRQGEEGGQSVKVLLLLCCVLTAFGKQCGQRQRLLATTQHQLIFFLFSFHFRFLWSKSKWDRREIFDDGSMKGKFWCKIRGADMFLPMKGTKRCVKIFRQIFTWKWKI